MSPAALAERRSALSLWDLETAGEVAPGTRHGREPEAALAIAPMLEAAVDAAWSALAAGFTAECLLCGGTVHPRWSAGAGVVGGRCGSCGTAID